MIPVPVPVRWKQYEKQIYKQVLSLPMEIQNALAMSLPGEDLSETSFWSELFVEKPHLNPTLISELDKLKEEDGGVVEAHIDRQFQNWGLSVKTIPAVTFVPRTRKGISRIIRWAKKRSLRVRCAGYRHTWSPQYADGDQVLISLLPLKVSERLPAWEPAMQNEHFQYAKFLGEDGTSGLCEFGAATTMEQIRVWSTDMSPGGGQCRWSLPLNVVMVEITLVGAVISTCHGAGRRHKTLADLVHTIEYIDHEGRVQKSTDRKQLQALAGSFGLIGVVVSLVMRLVPMEYVTLQHQKLPLEQGIPRLDPADANEAIIAAQAEFERHCRDDYYCEWFWFAQQKEMFLNCFNPGGNPANVKHYPSEWLALNQWIQSWIAERVLKSATLALVPDHSEAKVLGDIAMRFMPESKEEEEAEVNYLSDALHIRRGIANLPVRNFEVEIPLYELLSTNGQTDYRLCNRAWNDAIDVVHSFGDESPLRLTLEMRIMGDSDILLAAQHGNKFGTISIEVVTTMTVPFELWIRFVQQLINRWFEYKNPHTGEYLNVRPHLSKEWFYGDLRVRNETMIDYVHRVYDTPMKQFKERIGGRVPPIFQNHFWAAFEDPL